MTIRVRYSLVAGAWKPTETHHRPFSSQQGRLDAFNSFSFAVGLVPARHSLRKTDDLAFASARCVSEPAPICPVWGIMIDDIKLPLVWGQCLNAEPAYLGYCVIIKFISIFRHYIIA